MDNTLAAELFDTDTVIHALASLYRSEAPDPGEIARWYSAVDFEALWMDLTCMCARIGGRTDYAGTPVALIPRLKGLSRYILTLNSSAFATFYALGEVLESVGITMVPLRDTALALGYPQMPRFPMWHTQAAIPSGRMGEAAWLANEAGFSVTARDGMLEISRSSRETVLLYPIAAHQEGVSGEHFPIPRPEAILVDLAQELCGILQRKQPRYGLHSRLLLACHLLDTGPDLEKAADLARELDCAAQLQLLLDGAAWLCPEVHTIRFLSSERTDALARTLLSLRALKPRPNRLRRMWLYACLEGADSPQATRSAFFCRLRKAVKKRLF